MSSLFRARGPAADDSGGKILRGRRARPPASPYHRPAADRDERRSWISGIVAGAGRLMSSLFKSESLSSSCSYSYSTDGDGEGSSINSHEAEDMDVSSKEPVEAKQIERKLEPVKDCNGTSLAIFSEIESKHAIEQLLMQETFSRDEGSNLIQIIESRVVEVGNDGKQKELDRITCNVFASPGTGKYLNLSRKLPEAISYSSGSPYDISPGPSAFQLLTPELRNSAVTEAKKWLEQKRLASGSKADFGFRPCSSSTKTLQSDFGEEQGSPIDVAKSYMRSLSPWRSPLLSGTRFEKTPCTRMLLYGDEASATPNYCLPSSKGLKRNHPAIGLQDTADEIRKVRLKLTDDESNNCTFKLIDSSKGYSKDEACKISSVADEIIHPNSSKLPLESLDASADFSVEHVGDYCSIGNLGVPGEKNDNVNYPVRTGNTMSPVPIDAEEAVKELNSLAVQSTHETSSLATLPSKLSSSVGAGPDFCDNPMPTSDDNQDVEEPWQVKEQLDTVSDPCTILIPTSKSVEHAGDRSEALSTSEAQKLPPVLRDVEEGTRLDDVNASSIQLRSGAENNSLNAEQISWAKDIHTVSDPAQQDRIGQTQDEARQPDGNDQTQHEASDLRTSADGPLAGFNTIINVALRDGPKTTSCNNDGPAADISNGICELASVETSNVPSPRKINSSRGRPRGGTKMKSIKDVLLTEGNEPQPSTSRGQGRKSVRGARRGRGRGKSFTSRNR